METIVPALVIGVFLGVMVGRMAGDQKLIDTLETVRDRRDEALHQLNLAKTDPLTGSNFTPHPRAPGHVGGWVPKPPQGDTDP